MNEPCYCGDPECPLCFTQDPTETPYDDEYYPPEERLND